MRKLNRSWYSSLIAGLVMAWLACMVAMPAALQADEGENLSEYEKKVRQCRRDHKKRKKDGNELKGTTRGILPGARDLLGMEPPEGAVTLLDEDTGFSRWKREAGGEVGWKLDDGVATVKPGSGDICTKEPYGDMWLHVEFAVPEGNGNSGVYIQQRYEVQVLNSHGGEAGSHDCGAIYAFRAPNVNAARPPGEWQSYDIVFRQPRWNEDDEKVENARITVQHNGELLHYDVEMPNKTGAGKQEGPEPRPLRLQDHGQPVKYRNVWLKPLELE